MPVLYGFLPSPPCRAVLMTAKAVGVDLEMKETSPLAGDNRTPEFIEMNPRHTIPTLDDDGYILTESRAIMCYLVDKYGAEDDQLFPKDPRERNRILERLMFDQGCLYERTIAYYTVKWIFQGGDLDEEKLPALSEACDFLDKFLSDSDWVAGDNMTLADIAIAVTVSQLEMFGFDLEPYSHITRWFETCKSDLAGYEDINQEGVNIFKSMTNK